MTGLDDPGWLREQYHGEGRTLAEIGEDCGVSYSTVSRRMRKHGIKTRPPAPIPDDRRLMREEWLREKYEDGMSIADLCDETGSSDTTVLLWMDRFDIDRREQPSTSDDRLADEEWLRERYVDAGMSLRDIAEVADCTAKTVGNWLKRHGIKAR